MNLLRSIFVIMYTSKKKKMKRYSFPYLTGDQRKALESILLEEIERQMWYSIIVFASSKTEIFICVQ